MVNRRTLLKSSIGVLFSGVTIKGLNNRFGERKELTASELSSGDYVVQIKGLSHPTIEDGQMIHNEFQDTSFIVGRDEYWSKRDKKINTNIAGFHHVFTDVQNSTFSKRLFNELFNNNDYVENELLSILNFAQIIDYYRDYNSTQHNDYTRYPAETLVDWRGDCKDKTVLFNALATYAGYEVGYAMYPNHVAPIITSNLVHDDLYPDDITLTIDDVEYLPAETTSISLDSLVSDPEDLMLTYTGEFTTFDMSNLVDHSIEAIQKHTQNASI